MAKSYQVSCEDSKYSLTEVISGGAAHFVDLKFFSSKEALLQFLDTSLPSQELRAAWETRLSKGEGFIVSM